MVHDVWVEVDLSALKHNLQQVRGLVGDGVKIMAVVKGNGFGHGYVEPARAFVEAGADAVAVTRLDEALILRSGGINAPILLFAPIQPDNARDAVDAGLEMTVTSIELARSISNAASELGKTAGVHVKVDTGMSRLGMQPEDVAGALAEMHDLPNLSIAGIYTHFATSAEQGISHARAQLRKLTSLINELKNAGIGYGLAHAANSAATLRMPESRLDMVRPGTLLYGQYPSASVPHSLDLKPTWRLKARVCEVKDLKSGSAVGYGREFTTRRASRTAVIPIGWSDGFTLTPEGPLYRQSAVRFALKRARRSLAVEINGRKAPVLGRVAMQMIVVDVTGIDGVRVGDEVTVPAMRIPTSPLIPRVYVQ
ncbi:MAG: alanine racemase [Armatimonadota bacterium]|nr:alanine racemase [bacterium]